MADPKQVPKPVKIIKGGLNIAKRLLEDDATALSAADRAEAGRKAAELIKTQEQVKASEALGQLMEKGVKRTTTTQADRTRVGGGNIGGAAFPAISQADPRYAGKVWGVMDEGTAARLKNLTDKDTAWTTMLGSANQLKTNPLVFDKLKRGFITSMKQGNLSDELAGKINHNLALTFGEGADIRDPKIWRQADTFEKRAALADVMMGQGIAPSKGGVAIGGEKSGKGVIFKPTDILKRETEPSLLHTEHGGDVPTFAAGPRLFRIEKESEFNPSLHPGFPTLLKGEDYGINMLPTPTEVYLPDWHARFKKNNPERKGPGYYDLALGVKGEGLPSQELNDEYIRHLLREGFKKGGSVDIDASDRRLTAAIEKRMAKGGKVDLTASDARLTKAIEQRMAGGGGAFKRLEFTEDDSPVQTGIHASKMGDNQMTGVSANLDMKGAGRLGVGSNFATRGNQVDQSTMVNYSNNIGDLGVNANVIKPKDAPSNMAMTNVMASYPVGEGRVTAGMHGNRMDGTHRVTGHSLGYNTPMGGGNLNLNVMKPKEGKPMFGAQYAVPFNEGGSAFKKIQFMDKGGKAGKLASGVVNVGKRLLADAPQAEALKLAQERAALPPAKGGLGLPKNNTPEQRAKAMGFDRDTYHGSFRDIKKLDPSVGSTESHAGKGVYSTDSAKDASLNYASIYGPDVYGRVERGLENRDKDFRKIHSRMRDETLTPRQQEIILQNTTGADNLGVVYPLKVRSDKSIHLDANESNPVMVGPFQQYDEAADIWSDTPHTSKFNEALDEFRELGGEANPVYDAVQEHNEAMLARDLFNAVKKAGDENGLYDPYTGDIVSGGVAAGDFMKHFGVDEVRHTPSFRNQELNIGNEHTISMNPDNVRSRFAAFDPWRKTAAIAASMGVAAPDLLAKEAKEKKKARGGLLHMDKGGKAGKLASGLATVGKRLLADAPVETKAEKQMRLNMMPTARIGLEAPGILIPSKMNNVREAVRNMKGNYGARRVERAADEIPNLEKMYQEDALKEAFTGDNASAMITLSPADFERYAIELEKRKNIGPEMRKLAEQGDIDKYTVPTDEYIQHLQRLQDGFSDLPYLNLFKDEVGLPVKPSVIGHEGRHRSRALSESGAPLSLVKINPRGDLREGMPRRTQEDFIEALKEELELSNRLVLPEVDGSYRRPAIELPDVYAQGGDVHMADGGKLVKGIGKLGKRLLDDAPLPVAERDANLEKFLEPSVEKRKMYHATDKDFSKFKSKKDSPVFATPSTDFANEFAEFRNKDGVNIMPVYVQAKNPFDYDNAEHMKALQDEIEKLDAYKRRAVRTQFNKILQPTTAGDNWKHMERAAIQKAIKDLGHDSFYLEENFVKNLGMYNPNQIKSATGNRGTYDLTDPDINKAEGGAAFKKLQWFDGGGAAVDLSQSTPLLTEKDWANIKRNAPEVYDWAKQNIKDEASQLKTGKGVKDFALRTGAQYIGGIPDLINLGLMGVDAIADTNLSSEKPWFGSEQYINAMHKAGMLGENEFPIAETVAGILAPAGLIKKGIKKGSQLYKGASKAPEAPKKRRGGLAAMSR